MEKGPLFVYFASQSGTAEAFAKTLVEEAREIEIDARLVNLRDFSEASFKTHDNLIFVCATHYEGSCPDDADDFKAWMEKNPAAGFVKGKKVAIFGLGNTKYDTFCFFSVAVREFLLKNGAVEWAD